VSWFVISLEIVLISLTGESVHRMASICRSTVKKSGLSKIRMGDTFFLEKLLSLPDYTHIPLLIITCAKSKLCSVLWHTMYTVGFRDIFVKRENDYTTNLQS